MDQTKFLEESLREKQEIIQNLRQYNTELQSGFQQSEDKVNTLLDKLDQSKHIIDSFDKKLDIKDRQIDALELELFNKDKEFDHLIQRISLLEQTIQESDLEIMKSTRDRESQLREIKHIHHLQSDKLSELQKTVDDQKYTIRQLKLENRSLLQLQEKYSMDYSKKQDEIHQQKINELYYREEIKIQELQEKLQMSQIEHKFCQRVRQMVGDCIQQSMTPDLHLCWKLLKNILQDYVILKKQSLRLDYSQ